MPALLLAPLLLASAACWRPSADVEASERSSLLHSEQPSVTGAAGGEQHEDSTVPGSPHQPVCEPMAGLVKSGKACSKDAFSDKAWFTATELDCQLNRVHSALFLLATRFQQAAKAQHSSWQRQHSAAWPPSDVANATTPEAASRVCDLRGASHTGPSDWCSLQACPSTCGRCHGQRHAITDSYQHLLVLPQPFQPPGAASYAYDGGAAGREAGSDVSHFDVEKINQGLWFATVLGNLENFSETEEVYFSKGVHSRLRYIGNDPAIYMELGAQDGTSSNVCTGARNTNLLDSGNRGYFVRGRPIEDVGKVGPFWQPPGRRLHAVASRLVLDHAHMPMGTLQVDVNMSMLATRFLAQPGAAYAAVVDASGRVLALAGPGWRRLFGWPCGGTAAEELPNCSWHPGPAGLALADAERHGGAELGGLLERMFDGASDCSAGMREGRIHFPKAEQQADRWHLASFCALSSVPRWGVIVAARPSDVLEAAKFSVLPAGPEPGVETEVAGGRVRATVRVAAGHGAEARVLTLLLRNEGKVAMPWMAQLPAHASGNSFGLELLTEPNASLLPGEVAKLDFRLSFGNTSSGTHSENVILKANDEELHGVCFKHPVLIHITVVYTVPKSWLRHILKKHGLKMFSAFCTVCLLVCIVPVLWYLRKEFRRRVKEETSQSMKIDEALQCLDSVSFPMVLLSASSFKRLGALVSHEELLRRHEDLWLHTVEEVKAFSKEKHIIFVSHQWTAFASPDPTNIQYEAMVMSIETLRAQEGWEEEDMYIWVDYSCIPQRHRGTQTLAINSLMVYASNVAAFVVVAPPVKHADLGEVCDKATYQCRAWCRAEQLSHLLALGPSRMYLAEGGALTHLGDIHNWLEQAKFVFQGNLTCCRREHEGMAKCDKELLVTPMLGLWAQLCQACEGQPSGELVALRDGIARRLDEIFPRTFLYARKGRPPEERPLFADLLELLPLAAEGGERT